MNGIIIAVDFDGTLCKNKFPLVGKEHPEIIKRLKRIQHKGAKLILWTCRSGKQLTAAVEWCRIRGLTFDYINESAAENLMQYGGKDTRKVYADFYIDDRAYIADADIHIVELLNAIETRFI